MIKIFNSYIHRLIWISYSYFICIINILDISELKILTGYKNLIIQS